MFLTTWSYSLLRQGFPPPHLPSASWWSAIGCLVTWAFTDGQSPVFLPAAYPEGSWDLGEQPCVEAFKHDYWTLQDKAWALWSVWSLEFVCSYFPERWGRALYGWLFLPQWWLPPDETCAGPRVFLYSLASHLSSNSCMLGLCLHLCSPGWPLPSIPHCCLTSWWVFHLLSCSYISVSWLPAISLWSVCVRAWVSVCRCTVMVVVVVSLGF